MPRRQRRSTAWVVAAGEGEGRRLLPAPSRCRPEDEANRSGRRYGKGVVQTVMKQVRDERRRKR